MSEMCEFFDGKSNRCYGDQIAAISNYLNVMKRLYLFSRAQANG